MLCRTSAYLHRAVRGVCASTRAHFSTPQGTGGARVAKVEKVMYKQGKDGEKMVIDYKDLIFVPSEKLKFDATGRCLLYYYKPRFFTYTFKYSKYVIPFAYICTLIKSNPFFLSFPASMPLMFIAQFWIIARLIKLKTYFRHVVAEIYLYRDGETLEVVLENQLWRKLKKDAPSEHFFIPSLKTPVIDSDSMQPLRGDLFPEEFPYLDTKPHGWAWNKYYRNPRCYFVIPKYTNYSNMEVLTAVFNGKIIDTSKNCVEDIDYIMKDQYKDK